MSELVWRKEPPDSIGLWARKAADGIDVSVHMVADLSLVYGTSYSDRWCRIGDLPVIVEPVEYREVTAADLLNGPIQCQVSDNGIDWVNRHVDGYIHNIGYPYVAAGGNGLAQWRHARVSIAPDQREPTAYRWKKSGAIYRIVGPSRAAGYVIAESNEGTVASYAESVFRDANVVEPLYE